MKRVLITGASSGIGRETALKLAECGAHLVLSGRRADALQAVAAEVEQLGGSAQWVVGSLEDAVIRAELVERAFGALSSDDDPALVNNAGVAEFGPFHEMSAAHIDAQLQTNLMAPLWLTHSALPIMLRAGRGHIVNVLSVTTTQVFPGSAAYSAAKAGLYHLGKILAAEYRKKGIRITQILPGAVDTPIWEGKSFVPPQKDMLPVSAVGEAIRDVLMSPADRSFDEVHLMPPKGIL